MLENYWKKLSVFVVLICLAACGAPSVAHKKAQFGADNLHSIPISPYYLPDPREDRIDHAWALTVRAAAEKPFFGFLKPNQMLLDPLFNFMLQLQLQPGQAINGLQTYSSVDACQGKYQVEASFQADGSLIGTMSFQDYSDNCSLVFNATLPFYGHCDFATGQTKISISPDELVGRIDTREYLFNGQLQLEMNAFQGAKQKHSAQVDLVLKDMLGPELHLEKLLFNWDETGTHSRFSLAGHIHFSQYGSVEIQTDGFLVSYDKNSKPFDGIIIYKGADDTWLRLRFPKSTFPGFFMVDSFSGMQTKGNF